MRNINEINNWLKNNKLNDNILNYIKGYLNAKDIEIECDEINFNKNDIESINDFLVWLDEDGALDPNELVDGEIYFKQNKYYNFSYIMKFKSLSNDIPDRCDYYYMLNSENKLYIDDCCDNWGWKNANTKQINKLIEVILNKNTIY
jgi:hypothetical protein